MGRVSLANQDAVADLLRQVSGDEVERGHADAERAVELPVCGHFVYVLWADTEPIYVGSSSNVLARLGQHMSGPKRPQVTRVTVKEYPSHWMMIEAELALIRRYRPPLNVAGMPI